MRRAVLVFAGLSVLMTTACTTTAQGSASPAAAASGSTMPSHSLPSGATHSCLATECDDAGSGAATSPGTLSLACAPLPAAMRAFDEQASAGFPGGRLSTTGSPLALARVGQLVADVVDRCGFKVMIDVAHQYPQDVVRALAETAVASLGPVGDEPSGLRCADLAARGYGPKQAVDYWFLWGSPDLMDIDRNGIPCQTVWPDVEQYMPAYY